MWAQPSRVLAATHPLEVGVGFVLAHASLGDRRVGMRLRVAGPDAGDHVVELEGAFGGASRAASSVVMRPFATMASSRSIMRCGSMRVSLSFR